MTIQRALTGILVLTLLQAAAFAVEATTPLDADGAPVVDHRDKIYGVIKGVGESHEILVYGPAGSTFKAKLKKNKDADEQAEATMTLTAPGGNPVPYTKGKADMPVNGIYTLTVTAAAGLSGGYFVTLNIKPENKYEFEGSLGEEETDGLVFGAMKGATLNWNFNKVDKDRLIAPDGSELEPLQGMTLPKTGEYTFVISGRNADYKATLNVKTSKASKRDTYLSAGGYDLLEMEIDNIDTDEGITDRNVRNIEIEGFPFKESTVDGSPPTVFLEKGKERIQGFGISLAEGSTPQFQRLLVSFDLTEAKTGKWKLYVRNPSGSEDDTKFKVIKQSAFDLPDGVRKSTEVWFIDFDSSFEQDLDLFGLRGTDEDVNADALDQVKQQTIFYLRQHFRLNGQDGRLEKANSVPVSFIYEQISKAGGQIGEDYNRLRLGGVARQGIDPTPDNPFLNWGYVGIDGPNANFDDIGEDAGSGWLPLREMNPASLTATTASFRQAFTIDTLSSSDAQYFKKNFSPSTQEEIDRNNELIRAFDTLGREVAAIAAHHIARAMGVPNSDSVTPGNPLYLSGTPDLFGQFAADEDVEFTDAEIEFLGLQIRISNLPGSSDVLEVRRFK
jgi:hypothetical protein